MTLGLDSRGASDCVRGLRSDRHTRARRVRAELQINPMPFMPIDFKFQTRCTGERESAVPSRSLFDLISSRVRHGEPNPGRSFQPKFNTLLAAVIVHRWWNQRGNPSRNFAQRNLTADDICRSIWHAAPVGVAER